MLSRNEYRGKLPYDTYVERYKRHEEAIFPTKKSTDLPKPGKDIPPTQEEIKALSMTAFTVLNLFGIQSR